MSVRSNGSFATRSATSARMATSHLDAQMTRQEAARLEKQVTDSVNEINRLMREIGGRFEEVGRHLFETYFDSNTEQALAPDSTRPAGFVALLQRAGSTLHATRSQLMVALRIAALNAKLRGTKWVDLSWSTRAELLPLLGSSLDFEALAAGVRYASQHRSSMRQVRDWMAKRTEGATASDTPATTPTPTVAASEKAVSHYNALSKSADRRKLINRFLNLPDERRAAMLANLKAGLRNLEKLTQEFEAAMTTE
jgi:hypothetical protein